MTICEYIDQILKSREISRRKLAISANIPTSSLQSAFQRNDKLSLDMLVPIVRVLGIDWGEIIQFGYNLDEFVSVMGRDMQAEHDGGKSIEEIYDWRNAVDEAGNQLFHSRKEYEASIHELDAYTFSEKEKELIAIFSRYSPEEQKAAISLLKNKNKQKEPAPESGLDAELLRKLMSLTPDELVKVDAFVQGLIAAR